MADSFIDQARLLVPWMPEELLQSWVDAYSEFGQDANLAKAAIRRHPAYEDYFPGNLRPDGSVRNDEGVYASTFEGYHRVVLEAGLNPELFAAQMIGLYEGDTSVTEFQQRVSAVRTRILDNIGEVRGTFGEFYGIDDLEDTAFVAAALDPSIGNDILNRRIDISTVAASGRSAGFSIGRDFASRLIDRGFDQQTAERNLFDPARTLVPSLARSAQQFGVDKTFDFDEFADAAAFADPIQTRRIRRLRSQESAPFTRSGIQRDQSGLTGLQER